MDLTNYLPRAVNSGSWVTGYTLPRLLDLDQTSEIILPICSLATPYQQLAELGEWVLPPLFHEALDATLKQRIVDQLEHCFPYHELLAARRGSGPRLRVVEVPAGDEAAVRQTGVLAFSVDTAVEEHGPHLPLATDTIQSYSVLNQLARDCKQLTIGPPVEYGQLTWGLPFGFSIDFTAELLTEYLSRFVDAQLERRQPEAIYVVDVHGSIVHRQAIVAGLQQSRAQRWAFRWLHEPLVEFASQRGDQHAGGVETALVERVSKELVDAAWWPARIDEIAARQMSFERAVELTPTLDKFVAEVSKQGFNGIVGDIRNYAQLDAELMFDRMLDVAQRDVAALLDGQTQESSQQAGHSAW